MQPIRNTCLPRPDVLEGGLADNHFAAQLDQVVTSGLRRDPSGRITISSSRRSAVRR